MSKSNQFTVFGQTFRIPYQGLGPEGFPVYQEQAQNQKGVHTPISGVTDFPYGTSRSEVGSFIRDRWADFTAEAKELHHKMLAEMRTMPKPNLKGL